ncbi:Coenzyme PQQ synthesis protein D [Lutibaculum baratangense AMV1]|uniref:PqqA binding protein n=1 Tax=Lutibaculum baratangense AMV1 TaxID=631454 RepID=V4RRM4_9HYPH|nr:pyrroloquinoline quinone biosynthesis peptide chaperone PqqD [Lutibaculum baratangense]ESR25810.1 Coenzyme PQQ synthesis protein D [Lutibaculum baratangense AMV1]
MSGEAPPLSPAVVPRLPRGVRFSRDEARGRFVLLAPERILEPDEIAVEILRRIDGEATLGEIVDQLARDFAAPREEVAADVEEFLRGLNEKGMIEL